MKRKLLVLLSFVLVVAIACSSCDVIKNLLPDSSDLVDECEHTYSDKWSTSATEHWHAATCEHAEMKSDVASHTDVDEDGKCDVCDYEIGHEHTYAEAWSSDDTHHWKVATCSHRDQKGELAKHTDANFDNTCDVCSAVLTVEAPADIAAAIELVLLRAGAISGGKLHYEYLGGSHEDVNPHAKKDIDYIFGTDSLYMSVSSWAKQPNDFTSDLTDFVTESDVMKGWYQLLDDNTVFSVTQISYDDYVGDYELNSGADVNTMKGYYCAVSTLVDAYGAENLLAALYGLSQSNGASEYVTTFDATNLTYTFSFAYLAVNTDTAEGEGDHVDYYEVEVSFTYNENGALTALTVVADCYTNSLANEEDNDYTYDQNSGTITMKDTALADTYTFVFTQTVGERTYVNENSKSKFVPTDYDFFEDEDCTASINGTITVTQNTSASVFVGGFIPEGSSILYVVDLVTLEGDESLNLWTYGNQIGLYANTVGTYTVNFTVAGVAKSFTVVVEEASDIGGGGEEKPENSVAVYITDNNGWFDLAEFTATESGDYTFVVPAGCGAYGLKEYNAFGDAFVDPDHPFRDDKNGGTFTVSIAEGETYKFYVKSPEKNTTVYITYTVSDYTGSGAGGSDIPESTLIIGYNNINATDVAFVYTASGAGKLTLTAGNAIMAPVEMSYSVNGGASTPLALGSSVELTLASGDKVVITVLAEGYSTLTAAWAAESTGGEGGDSDITVVQGTYTGTDDWGIGTLVVTVDATTVTFNFSHPYSGSSSVTATYAVVDGAVVLYDEDGNVLNPLAGLLKINAAGVPVSADYNGNTYALTAGGSSEGGEGGDNTDTDGSEDKPHKIASLPTELTFYSDTINKVYYLYTATANGFITITLSVEDDSWCDIYPYVDGEYDGANSDESNYETVATFFVKAGTTYRIGLGTFYIAGETTFSIAFAEGECEHSFEPVVGWHPDAIPATCVAPGVAVYECTTCGETKTEATEIDPEGHSFNGEEEILTAANCATQTNGLMKVHCSNEGCTATTEEEIAYYFAHDWDVQKETYATCTEAGEYYAVCTNCGTVESYTNDAFGHYNYELTCGQTGVCYECGTEFTLEHDATPATCTEAAFCYICWSEVGEPLGHNFVDGVCTVCEQKEGAEIVISGILYADEENTVTVTDEDLTAGYLYFTFTPWESGNYFFDSIDLYVPNLIDSEGNTVTTNDDGYFGLESYSNYTVVIELGSWLIASEYTITPTFVYPEGHQNNPFWLFGNEATVAYPGDYTTVWYQFYPATTGTLTVTADDDAATLLLAAAIGYEVDGTGSVSLGVVEGRLYYIGVLSYGITTPTDIALTLSYVEGEVVADGTVNTPYAVAEENTVSLDSWCDAFFMYISEAQGTLTLTTSSENYIWYATTDLSQYNEAVTGDLSIDVLYGECVYIYISNTSTDTASITFGASFEIDPEW